MEGDQEAKRKLGGVAQAEQKVGKEATAAGKAGTSAFTKLRSVFMGLGAGLFGASGVIAALRTVYQISNQIAQAHERINTALRDRMTNASRGILAASTTRALADIRGVTPSGVVRATLKQAQQYDVTREAAEQTSFLIESGITPQQVGGRGALGEITGAALQTAAAMGQSLDKMSPIQIMEVQAGILQRAAAEGPQALGQAVKALGIPEETVGGIISTMDKASAVRRQELVTAGREATWADIEASHKALLGTPASQVRRAAYGPKVADLPMGKPGSLTEAARIVGITHPGESALPA